MFRSFRILFLGGVLIAASAATAGASPLSLVDVYDPADVRITANNASPSCAGLNAAIGDSASAALCQSLTWTHVLSGFDPLTDTLTAGVLSLSLSDDVDTPAEKFDILMDLLSANNVKITSTQSFNVLTQLLDGSLQVTLSAQNGDLLFAYSTLSAEGTRTAAVDSSATPVPEPSTLLLFGGGAAAIGGRRWLTQRRS